jgi:hypothetical protein
MSARPTLSERSSAQTVWRFPQVCLEILDAALLQMKIKYKNFFENSSYLHTRSVV